MDATPDPPVAVTMAADGSRRITLKGAVTVAVARSLHEAALREFAPTAVTTFALDEVTRLDSSAVQIFLATRRAGGRLRFTGVAGQPRGVLRLAGLEAECVG